MATRCPSVRCTADHTVPIAPRPISFSRRYLPPNTSPSRMVLGSPLDSATVSLMIWTQDRHGPLPRAVLGILRRLSPEWLRPPVVRPDPRNPREIRAPNSTPTGTPNTPAAIDLAHSPWQ